MMTENELNQDDKDRTSFKIKAGVFLSGIAGISLVSGFARTVMSAKKQDPSVFEKAQAGEVALLEGGTKLAARALAWGSLFAIVGVGGLCFTFWKLTGAKDMKEFTEKMRISGLKVKRNDPPRSRTEFDGLNDLLGYLSEWRGNTTDTPTPPSPIIGDK